MRRSIIERTQLFKASIPTGARCCPQHTIDRRLTSDAIDRITRSAIHSKAFNSSDVQLIISQWQLFFRRQRRFDFDDERSLDEHEYRSLTSLSKNQFDDLIQQISSYDIRNSSYRSIRTSIALLLCKLRLGLSNELLAILFQLPNKRTVARAIKSTRSALMNLFVPKNVGFEHVSRDEIIHRHTSSIARKLLCDDDTDIIVADGSYLYIQVRRIYSQVYSFSIFFLQKTRNNEFQRKSYNLQKKRSLLKPMMIISTTGCIIACIGPFLSDFSNNDASMMKNIFHQNIDEILEWIGKVTLTLNRSFF